MKTGVYSDQEILAAIESGHIVCHPLIKENITGSSVDVTLGEYYYRTEYDITSSFYNPFSQKAVSQYFGEVKKAIPHQEWAQKANHQLFSNIAPENPIIILRPGERILAHTQEFIGIKPPGTSTMQSRSTWGRNGVAVCLDAGWGDPGFINRWTMEVYNMNQHHSIVLPVGERIAQMIFYHTGPVTNSYNQRSGRYQETDDLQSLIKSWRPEMMLPKAYPDKESGA